MPRNTTTTKIISALESLQQTFMHAIRVLIKTHISKQQDMNNHKIRNAKTIDEDRKAAKK